MSPRLSEYVKHIDFRGEVFGAGEHNRVMLGLSNPWFTETEIQSHVQFVGNSDVHFRDLWVQELQRDIMDAFVALLVFQHPNLRSLS